MQEPADICIFNWLVFWAWGEGGWKQKQESQKQVEQLRLPKWREKTACTGNNCLLLEQ